MNNLEILIRNWKLQIEADGIMRDLKKHQYYRKLSEVKREKRLNSIRRNSK